VLDAAGAGEVVASDLDILHGVARGLAGGKLPRIGDPN
jgi:hypothetical protein